MEVIALILGTIPENMGRMILLTLTEAVLVDLVVMDMGAAKLGLIQLPGWHY